MQPEAAVLSEPVSPVEAERREGVILPGTWVGWGGFLEGRGDVWLRHPAGREVRGSGRDVAEGLRDQDRGRLVVQQWFSCITGRAG